MKSESVSYSRVNNRNVIQMIFSFTVEFKVSLSYVNDQTLKLYVSKAEKSKSSHLCSVIDVFYSTYFATFYHHKISFSTSDTYTI